MAYSIDLRKKALKLYAQCNNTSQIANVYGIARPTLYRWLNLKNKQVT
ncbi:helix-turn-helix domain-containing protein [Volucribacter amazonae]